MKTALFLIITGIILIAVGWHGLGLIVGLIGGFVGLVVGILGAILGVVIAIGAIFLPFAIIGLIFFALFKIIKAVVC